MVVVIALIIFAFVLAIIVVLICEFIWMILGKEGSFLDWLTETKTNKDKGGGI